MNYCFCCGSALVPLKCSITFTHRFRCEEEGCGCRFEAEYSMMGSGFVLEALRVYDQPFTDVAEVAL